MVFIPATLSGEADESLHVAGFTPSPSDEDGEEDDESANSSPPPLAPRACGGGQISITRGQPYIEVWSCDKKTSGRNVGFICVYDLQRSVIYAKLGTKIRDVYGSVAAILQGASVERATKGAITTLFDLSEACSARKITLGLSPEDANCAELVCSLLYLGFQVAPTRKSPLDNVGVYLDFDMAAPTQHASTTSDTHTATSDVSTSAEDDGTALSDSGHSSAGSYRVW